MQHVRVAAAGAGGGAGRVEQHGIERAVRFPGQRIGRDQIGGQTNPVQVGVHPLKPLGAGVERGDLPACGGQLQRLAPRRGAKVEHAAALARAQQPGGQAGGQVLDPPGALFVAGQVLHRRTARQAQVAGEQ